MAAHRVLLNPTLIARVDMLKMMRTLPDVPRIVILTRTNVLLHALGGLSDRETHKRAAWPIPIVFDGNRSTRLRRVLEKLCDKTLTSIAYRVGGPHTYHVLYEDLQRVGARDGRSDGVGGSARRAAGRGGDARQLLEGGDEGEIQVAEHAVRRQWPRARLRHARRRGRQRHPPAVAVRAPAAARVTGHARGRRGTTSLRPSGEVAIDGECARSRRTRGGGSSLSCTEGAVNKPGISLRGRSGNKFS